MRLALTQAIVEGLRPVPSRRINYFDTHRDAPPGFLVRVSSSGAAAYYVKAGPLWVHLEDVRAISLEKARKVAQARLGEIALGQNPNARARDEREQRRAAREAELLGARAGTVATLVRSYIESQVSDRKIGPNSERQYRQGLARDVEGTALGRRRERDVVRADVREHLAGVAGRSEGSHDNLLRLLRASWRWGMLEEAAPGVPLAQRDPTVGLTYRIEGKARTAHLDDEGLKTAWPALDELGPVRAAYARLLILLGPRRTESGLTLWTEVDLVRGVWRMPTERRKVAITRKNEVPDLELPLAPLACGIFRELHAITGRGARVFPRLSVSRLNEQLHDLCPVREGESPITLHALRRTMSMGLERLEAPPHVVSMALGREVTLGAAQADVHYILSKRPAELRLWLTRWAEHVARVVGLDVPAEKVVAMRG